MSTIEIVIIGAGGHASVIADMARKLGHIIVGLLDDNCPVGKIAFGVPISGKISDCRQFCDKVFVIGIGDNMTRENIANTYNLSYATMIHPAAVLGEDVEIEEGTVVMAGAIINSGTVIGRHCIINTGAIIEHDSKICDYAHISPGVTMGGGVQIGKYSHVGIGATIKNGIEVCNNVVVGAGAVVVKNVTHSGTYVGVPARIYLTT